jgi:hypothetical protein
MGMLRLATEIQEKILSIPDAYGRPEITERQLRPIESIADHRVQIQEFQALSV